MQSFENYVKNAKKELEVDLQQRLKESSELYGKQTETANAAYNKAVKSMDEAYNDAYDENAVQRLINERQIAENMANLGLTDSGLSRTQQTAAQLSYTNTKNKIDRQRQAAADELAAQLAETISSIEQNRLSSESSIKESYSQRADSKAAAAYEIDANTEAAKEQAKYNYLIKTAEMQNNAKQEKYHGFSLDIYDKIMDEFDKRNLPAAERLLNRYAVNLSQEDAYYWAYYLIEQKAYLHKLSKPSGYSPE